MRRWIEFDLDSDSEWTDCRVSPAIPVDVRAAMMDLVTALTEPGGEEGGVSAMVECLTTTRSREHSELDMQTMIGVFARDLAGFPADVVSTAFRQHARCEKWWPAFSEILERCHRMMRWRKSLKAALERIDAQEA